MTRSLLLALMALVAGAAAAQPVYNGLGDADEPVEWPGVRLGLGVGASVYDGPDLLVGSSAFQSDVVATTLGLTAEVSFPLSGPLYGRVTGGLLNVGADGTRPDVTDPSGVPDARYNPFLTGPVVLAEADLLYYVVRPRAGALSPYVFSGLSGLFATGDAAPGAETTALAIPVGLGVEYGVRRNLSLFAEGSYRFGITEVGGPVAQAFAASSAGDVCDKKSPDFDKEACKAKGGTPIPDCDEDPSQARCPAVSPDGDSMFDPRFNSGLVLGGLRLGFGRAPAPVVPPPPAVLAEPPAPLPPAATPAPAPMVCDLVELNATYFDYGSSALDRRARALLDENVGLLLSNPACCVFIDGYTDTAEGDRFGMRLAGQRARAVYDYYLGQGLDASRLQVRDRGVAVPSCDKEDPGPGCERNRRVESLPVDCERFRFLLENPSYDSY
ncbi:OmpA family protein [Rubrivirga sp.]|uniref:OmpA family protein n=1 Tax=Rubrivirga sp. TaxID=1885344 RepID=UPI003B528CF3